MTGARRRWRLSPIVAVGAVVVVAAAPGSALGSSGVVAASRTGVTGGPAAAVSGPRAVLAFLPSVPNPLPHGSSPLQQLAGDRDLPAAGVVDPTQGGYNEQQALLDIGQGARVSHATYRPVNPPAFQFQRIGRGARVLAWSQIAARGRSAPADIVTGLLASSIPGGAGYATAGASVQSDAIVAADRQGRIEAVSTGPAATLPTRVAQVLRGVRFAVVDLPPGEAGLRAVHHILALSAPGDLTLVLQQPPYTLPTQQYPPQFLALGAVGLPGGRGAISSRTTRLTGVVTGTDIAPTVLRRLGLHVPSAMQGQLIRLAGRLDTGHLQTLENRLRVLGGRRFITVLSFALVWLGVVLLLALGADRRGLRAGLRLGGLAAMWGPTTVLIPAAVHPSRLLEIAIVVGGGFVLGAACDWLLGWPRALVAPAAAALIVYPIDLARGGPLILESILGANPLLGSRFYGIGNEMVSSLPVVVFAGVAAILPQRAAVRRDLAVWLGVGLALTGLVSAGVLGAKVGAVFAIGGATAAGAVMLLPGGPSRRGAVVAVLAPILGLVALAAVDLATGAGAHFTRTILDANGAGDVLVTFRRKLQLAWEVLRHGLFPLDTIVCVLAIAAGVRYRERLLATVAPSAAWRAYFAAVAFGSVLGSFTNDSGPLLLVIGTFGLACVAIYLRGDPRLARLEAPISPGSDGHGRAEMPVPAGEPEPSAQLLTNS